jgi:redox-sensitive bicupin YhaK (pirin superfamily)
MLNHRRWSALDGADHGWLKAKHHFAVSAAGNPAHGPLGSLIVWNDDEIAANSGFPLHGHKDIEIITYVRQGVVVHQDNLGSIGRIEAGEVQVMSAGTGIRHSEYNPGNEPLKIYQIWILPREPGGKPCWGTKPFPKVDRSGRFVVLASGMPGDDDALSIRANGRVLGMTLNSGRSVRYDLDSLRSAYLVVAAGLVTVNGEAVGPLDGLGITKESAIDIVAMEDAELLMVVAG